MLAIGFYLPVLTYGLALYLDTSCLHACDSISTVTPVSWPSFSHCEVFYVFSPSPMFTASKKCLQAIWHPLFCFGYVFSTTESRALLIEESLH